MLTIIFISRSRSTHETKLTVQITVQRHASKWHFHFPFTFRTHILHIHICSWSQCLSIHFTRMGKQLLQKYKPKTTGYVTIQLHGRKHTNNTDMIWKNTLNSALILKQHYKHGAVFFLFSIHAILWSHDSTQACIQNFTNTTLTTGRYHKNVVSEGSILQGASTPSDTTERWTVTRQQQLHVIHKW